MDDSIDMDGHDWEAEDQAAEATRNYLEVVGLHGELGTNPKLLGSFGKFLKEQRKAMKLTTRALAERVGLSQPTVSQLENRRVTLSAGSLAAILVALGTTPYDFEMWCTERAEADARTANQATWARRFQDAWQRSLESGMSTWEAAAEVLAASVAAQGRSDWNPEDPNARDGEPAQALAKVLRAHRVHRGWSHRHLAELAGIEIIRIKNFEQAVEAPTVNELEAIGRAFGVGGLHWEVGPTTGDIRCVLDAGQPDGIRTAVDSRNDRDTETEEAEWVALLRSLAPDDQARVLDLARRLGRQE